MSPLRDAVVLERLFGRMQHDLWQLRKDLKVIQIKHEQLTAQLTQQRDTLEQECEAVLNAIRTLRGGL